MEYEIGNVVEIKDDQATIQMVSGNQCTHCGAKAVCIAQGDSARVISVPVTKDLNVGDSVELSFSPSSRVKSAFIIFLLPILFMIMGVVLTTVYFENSETMTIPGAFGGLVFGFFIVWILNKFLSKRAGFKAVVKKMNLTENVLGLN